MIEFQNVSKRYPNGFEALKDINLKIEQGEFAAVIGLSGAGKSTLIRTINRMHDITEGTLTVDGINVMELQGKSLRAFRRKIGMIFQSFNLITRTTVIKNVLISVRDQADNLLSIIGAVAPAFTVQEILGENELRAGETIQAFYRRADGSWIALPVVIQNGAIAISIPSFGDYANVVFMIVQGTSLTAIPGEAMTSPNT